MNLLENAILSHLTMVHGTDAFSAKIIMREGFVAKPESKVYDAEEEPLLESLDGTYFAESLKIAVRYAYRAAMGNAFEMAVIEATIDLNDAVIDEDDVMMALTKARKCKTKNDFIRVFHSELDFHLKVPISNSLILQLRDAWTKARNYDEIDEYRNVMDRVCRFYAAILQPPVMVEGRSIRLPNGLSVEHITSVTIFQIDSDYIISDYEVLRGSGIDRGRLQDIINELSEEGFY